jgi:uncharacterized protein (TIGR02246 family)
MRLPKVLLLFPVVFVISQGGLRAQTVQGTPADLEAIHRIIQGHAIGWNKGDAKMVARLWHEDGDIRTSSETASGTGIVRGREAIQLRYEKMFAGWAKGTLHSHPGQVNIRFLTPDVAVGDGFYEVKGIKGAEGKEQPVEKGTWAIVVTKVNGEWGIAELR